MVISRSASQAQEAFGSNLPEGEMRAHFGVFLTFRDALITRQRNYDCFDPF